MGREFKYIADESGEWSEIVFIDDHATAEQLLGCPVCGFHTFRKHYKPEDVRFAITIGEPKFRREAFARMTEAGYRGALVVHPSAVISPDAEVGEGAVIAHGAFIGSLARVGKNFYGAKGASIGHDAVIGDHVRVGVGAFVGGHAVIGENAFIGSGAMLKDRIRIGEYSVVGIGSAVFSDVESNTTVMGNPARITNEGAQGLLYAPSKQLTSQQEAPPEGGGNLHPGSRRGAVLGGVLRQLPERGLQPGQLPLSRRWLGFHRPDEPDLRAGGDIPHLLQGQGDHEDQFLPGGPGAGAEKTGNGKRRKGGKRAWVSFGILNGMPMPRR